MTARRTLGGESAFKVGLFGSNCNSGRILTAVPERWSGTWEDNLRLAQLSDEVGIDFLVPIGRWKGYGGVTDHQGKSLETITWATGLLAATRRLVVFGTVHAPLFHPLVAAKMMVTADHVGSGRFALNIVAGWNEDEFKMFGVTQRDHEGRYAYAQEWVDIVRATWERDDFDYEGEYFHLQGIRENPKPYGGTRPIIMNAGMTPTGRAYAMKNSDMYFTGVHLSTDIGPLAEQIMRIKAEAQAYGREIDVFSSSFISCRPTRAEAEAYVHYAIDENADWEAMERLLEGRRSMAHSQADLDKMRENMPRKALNKAIVGDPDDVANALALYARAGLRGLALTFVNFVDEVPFFSEHVLPRLERMGLRVPATAGAR